MKKISLTLILTILSVMGFTSVSFAQVDDQQSDSQTISVPNENSKLLRSARPIPNHYIVVLNDNSALKNNVTGRKRVSINMSRVLTRTYGGSVNQVYDKALHGYATEMSEADAEALSHDPRVKYIEQDGEVSVTATQGGAAWGLDRIDERNLPMDGNYVYNATGKNVNAYIIDTGIRTSHTDFGARAFVGFDAMNDGQNGQDCFGHGTHVAGTVGGAQYGVAKNVRLYSVRVLGCDGSGTVSGVLAGIDWVAKNRVLPAVANISLSMGTVSQATDDAVQRAIAAGVTFVVAAGNDNGDACNYSPARASNAITVGATTSSDARAWFSNYGSCVDIFAPGENVTSDWYNGDTVLSIQSGTSMASPHVAGAVALYLEGNPTAAPAAVTSALKSIATPSKLTDVAGSPNLLLYTASITAAPQTIAPGLYVIRVKHSGKALDVTGSSTSNGARIIQQDYLGNWSQQWQVERLSDGYYRLTARHSGKALDIYKGSLDNGAFAIQWDKTTGDNQRWKIEAVGNGFYKLTAKHSGKVLDVSGASKENGAGVLQWSFNGGDNQKWSFTPVQQ